MNLRDLTYFTTLAETRNFTAASERCHVSQPTLSTQIRKLEDTLHVTLFERSNKDARLTPVGESIHAAARRALEEVKTMQQLARNAQDPLGGILRLGAFPTLAPYYLPEALARIQQAAPALSLQFFEDKTENLLAQLQSGTLDAALLALPAGDATLQSIPLFHDPFLVAVSTQHPLASCSRLKPEALLDYPLLLLEDGHCLRDQALEICHMASLTENKEFRATSLETLRQMVRANRGITLVPAMAALPDAAIRYIPFKGPGAPSRRIGLFWRKSSPRQPLMHHLAAALMRNEPLLPAPV